MHGHTCISLKEYDQIQSDDEKIADILNELFANINESLGIVYENDDLNHTIDVPVKRDVECFNPIQVFLKLRRMWLIVNISHPEKSLLVKCRNK